MSDPRNARSIVRGVLLPATFALVSASGLVGCVRAPEVAVVSAHTALERQAAGEYPRAERELADVAISPAPVPIPREQLTDGAGASGLGVVDEMVARAAADQDRVDALLVARCIGEASTALLEVTASTCRQEVDAEEVARLVGRINVHRRQVWAFVAQRSPGSTEDQARDRWRTIHLERVVCGGQVQNAAGAWEIKRCEE